jgi:predicted glycosyltransferase
MVSIVNDQCGLEKRDKPSATRLDVLLYAHDGRGLGHASRTIGIGMALRRLYPDLRVLFVSGASLSQSMIGKSGLDWIKLPSYASTINNGISTGVDGPANFSKFVLAEHRSAMLADIITSFRPKVVLVDHSPLGKREELLSALNTSRTFQTKWILGLRAVIGNPAKFWSEKPRKVFNSFYQHIFWYGDRSVLGPELMNRIDRHFGCRPIEMGYVSRLYETLQLSKQTNTKTTGTISVPWLSRASMLFIKALSTTISLRDPEESWNIFIHSDDFQEVKKQFIDLANVQVSPVGEEYAQAILNSRLAIIYGGYNSLVDVATAGIPALVVLRDMKDKEQQQHITHLVSNSPGRMIMVEESTTDAKTLDSALSSLLKRDREKSLFTITGSENAAHYIATLL